MGWEEIASKIKLVDINAKVEPDQLGVVNVKVENKTFVFNFPDADSVRTFLEVQKTSELEKAIQDDTTQRLENVIASPSSVTDSTRAEMLAASAATAALIIAKKST